MNLLSDILTYIRRIIKSPSNTVITDALLIDYINRFWIMDVDARVQLFDLKTKYQFQTTPGVDQYNMPLYEIQIESTNPSQSVSYYPVYQGFFGPAFVNGVQVPFDTQKNNFFNIWPNVTQYGQVLCQGNGTAGPYTLRFRISPINVIPINPPIQSILRGHVDLTGVIANANSTSFLQDPIFGTSINTAIPTTSTFSNVYFTTSDAFGNNNIVADSGQFLLDASGNRHSHLGLLMNPGSAPYGNTPLAGGYDVSFPITGATQSNPLILTATTTFQTGQSVLIENVGGMIELNNNRYTVISNGGTTLTLNVDSTGFTAYTSGGTVNTFQNVINYLTGIAHEAFFPLPVPAGVNITGQCLYFQSGLPRAMLYYNNVITLRSPPDRQYFVEVDAYLSPAAFFNSANAIPFAYMAEYIARGAARKILSDTGDVEQFQFYEPLFIEQERLVWKRSQRQFTSTRTQTIYSQGINQGQSGFNNIGGNSV